jgi:WD40 repeat protein
MACEFSAPFTHTSSKNVLASPSAQYVASISGSNLYIRDPHHLDHLLHIFSCIDKIDKVDFSKDSEYIFCALFSRSTIQVFSLNNPQWRCRINESIAGIVSVAWSPDSRHLLVESDFGIQLSIWSLVENTSSLIHSPKLGCFAFSDCHKYLAVGHRLECKDHLAVYSTGPWRELNKFKTRTVDMVSVQWIPAGTHLLVLDSHLCYRIMVYTPAGEVLIHCPCSLLSLTLPSLLLSRAADRHPI